ncbi:YrdB family protein [Lysinibacillus sp. KU-BSD001]|uniref:YrdB family protein n=1 Tax=Lysinibacillus sp. KU-BSD001 TaxID=3141328 RepID=UPI0036E660E7
MIVNLLLRFLLEIATLAIIGYWGLQQGNSYLTKILFCTGLLVVTISIWATFGAPKASLALEGISLLTLELVIFGIAAVILWTTLKPAMAVVFVIAVSINRVLIYFFNSFY